MENVLDYRQELDIRLLWLRAEKDYAAATFLEGQEREDFRMDIAFDWAHVNHALKEPFLRPDDKLFLKERRRELKRIRRRIRTVDDAAGSVDNFEEYLEAFETGMASHLAMELIQGVRARLADPWTDGLFVAQIACVHARDHENDQLLLREADAFARRMVGEPNDVMHLYEIREMTVEALQAVVTSFHFARN